MLGVGASLRAVVREILLPIMKEIKNDLNSVKGDLNSVKNDLSTLNKTVSNLSGDLEDYKQQTASELAGLTSELAGLTSELAGLHTSLQSNTTEQLTQLCEKVNMLRDDTSSLKGDLSSFNDSMNRISDNVEAHDNHVTTELMELDQNLQQNLTLLLKNTYGYVTTCGPGGTWGWRRVVYLDMTDPNTTCPSGWRLTSHSKRTCGRLSTSSATCDSVTFPVSGDYTRVCGRIIGYQNESPDAFNGYNHDGVANIDGVYVDGVSLTHGSPRQHIWTFAAGVAEVPTPTTYRACPCDTALNITTPPFVGEDYFCESGYNSGPWSHSEFYPNDPLWDGDGCTASSTCCSFNNPPYFTKQLPSSTTDDLEVRLCHDAHTEDTPIELIELYVQ